METETATPNKTSPQSEPQINTYHCICSTLLLATTHELTALPRRAEPALDRAYILPLPRAAIRAGETVKGEHEEVDEEEEEEERDAEPRAIRDRASDVGYSLLLSTTQDRRPTVVRRGDGFERRILLRCGRCRLVVGYKLDPARSAPAESGGTGKGGEKIRVEGEEAKLVYLLPGGLLSSEDLKNGKTLEVVAWSEWGSKFA